MNDREFVLDILRKQSKNIANQIQTTASDITGTELNAESDYIPDFSEVVKKTNILKRKPGFVCKSSAGRVVTLIQPYDSDVYNSEPEELPAQWGFVWSKNPEHALPFIALSTSPYNTDEVCTDNGDIYASTIENNVWAPSASPQFWKKIER